MIATSTTRICSRCGEERDSDDFYPRNGVCKPCVRKRSSDNYAANRETRMAQQRSYHHLTYVPTPRVLLAADELAKRQAERDRRWRRENPKKNAAKKRRHYLKHHAEIRVRKNAKTDPVENRRRVREWALANPERARELHRASQNAREARKRGQFVEVVDPQVVWERDEGICGICHLPAERDDFHVDHVIPLSKGGEHSYANTQVSHPPCNLRKGAKNV